jgi:photosynthetic reaction center cytochrome c subunit
MKRAPRRTIRRVVRVVFVCMLYVLATASAIGQAAQQEKPLMADDVFANVQVLHGLTVDEFMGTMGFISSSLALNCSGCHDPRDQDSYALDNPRKQMARRMILMVDAINKANFGGKRVVTCYTCHRGADRPKGIPSLVEQYSAPPDDDPNEVELSPLSPPNQPSPDQVFDTYIKAIGGAERLAALKSFVARGTYQGFDTAGAEVPFEIYARSPNQRTTVVHLAPGAESVRVVDGQNAWNTSTGTLMEVPVVALSGAELQGAKLEASLMFPGQIRQLLKDWITGFATTLIDDRLVHVVQGTEADDTPVKFYFDRESGLLLRMLRYANTRIGLNPIQVDYADYRTVSGVEMPFKITVTWTDGRSVYEFSKVEPNAPIDASRFARPVPPPKA